MNSVTLRSRAVVFVGCLSALASCVAPEEGGLSAADQEVASTAERADAVSLTTSARTLVYDQSVAGARVYNSSADAAMFSELFQNLDLEQIAIVEDSVENVTIEQWGLRSPKFFALDTAGSELPAGTTLEFDASSLESAQVLRWNESSLTWEPQVIIRRDAEAGAIETAEASAGLYVLGQTREAFDARFASPVWDFSRGAEPILTDLTADEALVNEGALVAKSASPGVPRTVPFYVNNVALRAGETVCLKLDGATIPVPASTTAYRHRVDVTLETPITVDYYYFRSNAPDCSSEVSPIFIQRNNNVVSSTTVTTCEPRPGEAGESIHRVSIPTTGPVTNLGTLPCVSQTPIAASVSVRVDRVFPAPGEVVCAEIDGSAPEQLVLSNPAAGRYTRYVAVDAPNSAVSFRYYIATGNCAGPEVSAIQQGYPASNTSVWLNDAALGGVGRCSNVEGSLFLVASLSAAGATAQIAGTENCENLCGNGVLWSGEQCDDGNTVADDACNNACSFTDQCDLQPCFPGVSCSGDENSFACGPCPAGTIGDGITCADENGCAGNPCFPGVSCTDAAAPLTGYTCGECPAGMIGDGETCDDLDACEAAEPNYQECSSSSQCSSGFTCNSHCVAAFNWFGSTIPVTCMTADPNSCASYPGTACRAATPGLGYCTKLEPICPAHSSCVDEPAPSLDYDCSCNAGYEYGATGCEDIDGCANSNCFDGVDCIDTPAPGTGFTCGACPAGYDGDGVNCADSDGCASDPCFAGVTCSDLPAPLSGFECGSCPEGTVGDGQTCVDVDGCLENPCFPGVECTDIPAPGSGFECGPCPIGTEGNGQACGDINSCLMVTCPANSECVDDPAPLFGYECACLPGFEMVEGSCVDVNGCAGVTCGPNAECVDFPAPSLDGACVCSPGYVLNGEVCVEFDACAGNPCGQNSTCVDQDPPSNDYFCECDLGYEPDGFGNCVDADACLGLICGPNQICLDRPAPEPGGSCACAPGASDLFAPGNCQMCPAGYADTADGCSVCAPGTFAASEGSTECTPCAEGMANPFAGNTQCYQCPDGMVPSDDQSTCVPDGPCSDSDFDGHCDSVDPCPGPGTQTCAYDSGRCNEDPFCFDNDSDDDGYLNTADACFGPGQFDCPFGMSVCNEDAACVDHDTDDDGHDNSIDNCVGPGVATCVYNSAMCDEDALCVDTDADDDGYPNEVDDCSGPGVNDCPYGTLMCDEDPACVDSDGDGYRDALDSCTGPGVAVCAYDAALCNEASACVDSDGDGIANHNDNCVGEGAAVCQWDPGFCNQSPGCIMPDSDGDGFSDYEDLCEGPGPEFCIWSFTRCSLDPDCQFGGF